MGFRQTSADNTVGRLGCRRCVGCQRRAKLKSKNLDWQAKDAAFALSARNNPLAHCFLFNSAIKHQVSIRRTAFQIEYLVYYIDSASIINISCPTRMPRIRPSYSVNLSDLVISLIAHISLIRAQVTATRKIERGL